MASRFLATAPNALRRATTKSSTDYVSPRLFAVLAITLAVIGPEWTNVSARQRASNPPDALRQMADTERAFAARAAVVNWKQAFLEYFADSAVGFDATGPGLAKDQIRALPDPPKDAQLLWEPRFGDIAASGDLGWLTGPSTSINPTRDKGQPRHGNYASVWKRQTDGTFKVVMDVGVNLPGPARFASGFTRAPQAGRFSGAATDAQATLADADRALSRAATSSQANAYRGRLAPAARLHRHDVMPRVGEQEILAWLAMQPASPTAEHRYAEAARSGDLGYTWGRLGMGYYVRVWSRAADGSWKVALDVVQ
jgi:ketosteroid isomerase-like protein